MLRIKSTSFSALPCTDQPVDKTLKKPVENLKRFAKRVPGYAVNLFPGFSKESVKPTGARKPVSDEVLERNLHQFDPNASESKQIPRLNGATVRALTQENRTIPPPANSGMRLPLRPPPTAAPVTGELDDQEDARLAIKQLFRPAPRNFFADVHIESGAFSVSDVFSPAPRNFLADVRIESGAFSVFDDESPNPPKNDSPQGLTDRILAIADNTVPRFAKPLLLAHALARATGGDSARARAALDILTNSGTDHADDVARADAFGVQRQLAKTGAGLDTLFALSPLTARDASQAAVQRDATMQAFKAADYLIARLPEGTRQPISLEETVALAHSWPPRELRATLQVGESTPAAPVGPDTCALVAKALVGAAMLKNDPARELPHVLREPYFNWRMGLPERGKGTELSVVQGRLFKLLTHADRAANGSGRMPFTRVIGYGKSPLSAMRLGMAGVQLGHPEDDYNKIAITDVIKEIRDSLGDPLDKNDPKTVDKVLRVAALEQWQALVDKKGWREKMNLGRAVRRLAAKAAADTLGVDVLRIKDSAVYRELNSEPAMNTQRLAQWARQSGLNVDEGSELGNKLKTMGELNPRGVLQQPPAQTGFAQAMRAAFGLRDPQRIGSEANEAARKKVVDDLIATAKLAKDTYSVQYKGGGQHGFDVNPWLTIASPTPIGPEVAVSKGREAVVEVGSTAQHYMLFVGTEKRLSSRVGVWFAQGAEFFNVLMLSGSVGVIAGRDARDRKGVMVYIQRDPENPEASRAKLLDLMERMLKGAETGVPPQSKEEMWGNTTNRYYKDPEVSIVSHRDNDETYYSGLSAAAGPRLVAGNWKFGVFFEADLTHVWVSRGRSKDASGVMGSDSASRTTNTRLNGSIAAVATPQPLLNQNVGPVTSVATSSVPIVGIGGTLAQWSATVQINLARKGGIDPARSFQDISFISVGEFARYVGSHKDEVVPGLGGGPDAEHELKRYLTKARLSAQRGNQRFLVRRTITPEAANKIDFYEATIAGLAPPKGDADRREIGRLNGLIEQTLLTATNWKMRALASIESTGEARSKGWNWLVQAQTTKEVISAREMSVLAMTA